MRIALIGATGFVGAQVLNELTSRGHQVTAIARHADKVALSELVKAVEVDVTDIAALKTAIQGHDAVISAFNAGWSNPNLYEDFKKGSLSIEEAVIQSGVKRLLVIGGAGSLRINGNRLVDAPDFPAEYKPGALAAAEYYEHIQTVDQLDWTFLSPAIEMFPGTSGTRLGSYRLGTDSPVFDSNNRSIIAVEDLAVVVVDEIEQNKHIKSRFTAAY